MILRCPNCNFGNHDTQKVCHKCKTALPPVRVEDFVGHARYLAFDARQHLAHAYFMKRMKKENDDALEIHKYAEMLETVDKGLEKFDVPNAEPHGSAASDDTGQALVGTGKGEA